MPTNYPKEESTYVINPEDGAETARLMFQDNLLTRQLGNLFPVEMDPASPLQVLDLACGPGGWVLNVAHDYPQAEVYGVDISQAFVRYATAQAWSRRLDNAYFQVMDILKPLDFEDNSFDVVSARLLFGFMPTRAWPGLLKECMRVLRPGGLVSLTENEIGITNGPISERLAHMFLQAMQRAGMVFSPDARHVGITPMLAGLLRDAGFEGIQQKAEILDYSAGSPVHDAFCENIMIGSKLAQPFLIKMGITTQAEVNQLYEQCLAEVKREDFRAIWYYLRAWGRKP